MKSDESAFSIVPSKMSSRLSMSTGPSSYRNSISSYASMVYSRLSFEDDLFTARVYKRNYRSPRLRRFWEKKPDHDHESVTSRQEVHQVVVAESKVSRPFKVSTTVRSSPMVVNSEAGNSNTGPIMISHISDVHSEGENQDPKDPLMNMGQELTTGGLEVTTLMISRNCDSLHVCPIHSSFIEDIGFMEPLLQNGGPDYDSSHILSELMYCARGIRWLPLHVFAVTGNLPVVQLLLEKGVSVSAEMKYGIQAIHLGARNGSITVLAALIEAGADVNCKDRDGYQPLHYLSDSQDRPDVIQYLAEQGAEVDSSLYSRLDNSDEQTPVYLACKNDFVGILEVLISLYALAGEFSTLKTKRAFDAAILHRSPLSLDFLLRFGFDPNNRRFDGCIGLDTFVMTFYNPNSPRDLAADKSVLQLLLKHTDLLAEDQSGHTLLSRLFRLQQITEEEDLELARLFLESLPEHKNFEANLLRSMMRSKDTEVDHRGMSLRSDRSLISAPVMAENSLGWG